MFTHEVRYTILIGIIFAFIGPLQECTHSLKDKGVGDWSDDIT